MTLTFVAAITQTGQITLPNLGDGVFIISAIGGGQAGETALNDGGALGYSRGGMGGCFVSKNIGKAANATLYITIGNGGVASHGLGGNTVVNHGGSDRIIATGGGHDVVNAVGDIIHVGGIPGPPVAYVQRFGGGGLYTFGNVAGQGGGGQGGGGAGGYYTPGGPPSNLINAIQFSTNGFYVGTYSGGGGGGEYDPTVQGDGLYVPNFGSLPYPLAPNDWWMINNLQPLITPFHLLGYGGGSYVNISGGSLGTAFAHSNDANARAGGGGAGDIGPQFPNVSGGWDPDYGQPWYGNGGDGGDGIYWQNLYGSGGGGGGGCGVNTPWWNYSLAHIPNWADLGMAKGCSGGDGGLYGGGGGGGGSGAPNGGLGNGIGGGGAPGLVIIEFLSVRVRQNQTGALIPLPNPRYAGNRRLLFYPWGIK